MPKACLESFSSSLVAAGVFLLVSLGGATPLRAQEAPRPSPREGADTTCGPSYGSKPFGDSTAARTKPGCTRVGEPAVQAPSNAPPAGMQPVPVSPKTDSLRHQADSASRRPSLP